MFQARPTSTSPPNFHGRACRASSARMRNSSCPVTARPAPTRPMPAPRPWDGVSSGCTTLPGAFPPGRKPDTRSRCRQRN